MLKGACAPSAICALAMPRSASSSMTLWPRWARATARLMETVVLPTPPLPLAIPITWVWCRWCLSIQGLCFAACRAATDFFDWNLRELVFGLDALECQVHQRSGIKSHGSHAGLVTAPHSQNRQCMVAQGLEHLPGVGRLIELCQHDT